MKKNGISLIVLVITIIVIIILAGSVVLSLSDNNPITGSNEAAFKTTVVAYCYELAMTVSNQYILNDMFNPNIFNARTWNGTTDDISGSIKQYISNITTEDGLKFTVQNSKLVYVGNVEQEKSWIEELGLNLPLGIDKIATDNVTINGQPPLYNNPIIPKGFKAINVEDANWNNVSTDLNKGLVIQDETGNQFVWVPVDGTIVPYTKWCTSVIVYNNVNLIDDDILANTIDENTQVNTYGGFYIARYEAGNATGTVVSKQGATVWMNINYTDSKIKAESMYTSDKVKSGLVTDTQWDTVMEWIKDSGKSVTNSTTWGNHSDSVAPADVGKGVLRVSGFNGTWKANNIYDIAGNTFEWVNALCGTSCVYRGGNFSSSGSSVPVVFRNGLPSFAAGNNLAFRVVLYLM